MMIELLRARRVTTMLAALERAGSDEEAQLEVLALLPRVMLFQLREARLVALRSHLIALATAASPRVALAAARVVWAASLRRPQLRRRAELAPVQLWSLYWREDELEAARGLVQVHTAVFASDPELLFVLASLSPASLSLALERWPERAPAVSALKVFERLITKQAPLERLRWAWRGVCADERELLLGRANGLPLDALRVMFEEAARYQELVMLLRRRSADAPDLWRCAARAGVESPHALLRHESYQVLAVVGEVEDVARLEQAQRERPEDAPRIDDTLKRLGARLVSMGPQLAGALSAPERVDAQGALSIASAARGAISTPE